MNPAKKFVARTQQFVTDHKVAIAITATATVTTGAFVKVVRGIVSERDEFLTENGLLEKFYSRFDNLDI